MNELLIFGYLTPALACLIVGTYMTHLDLSCGISFKLSDLMMFIFSVITPVLNAVILCMILHELSRRTDIVLIEGKK